MKKIIMILAAIALILTLTACGGNDGTTTTTTNNGLEGGTPTIDFGQIMAGNAATTTIWGLQDESVKAQMIAEGAAEGYDVSFAPDGTMTVVDGETGDIVTQKPDGTWTVKGADGSEGQLGGNWPDNEFTRLLPKPEMALLGASTTETDFSVAFQSATLEQIKAYVEQVKAKGFTVDAETEDEEIYGMVLYSYTAKNAAGYTVTVGFTAGTASLVIEKAE